MKTSNIIGLLVLLVLISGGAYVIFQNQSLKNQLAEQNNLFSTTTQTVTQPTTNQNNSNSASCGQFTNLHIGDTDATTNGEVSQLQEFLNISPTTGTYGPRTQIAYTNKCVGGNTQPTSVAGMNKYTDANFGFSFWYPSFWTVSSQLSGNIKFLDVKNASDNIVMNLNEVVNNNVDNPTNSEEYYFDSNTNQWMYAQLVNGKQTSSLPADVSVNTMGGLHILKGSNGDEVVPLSTTKFINIYDNSVAALPLVNTIVATDPTIATPISTAQQISTIQAEASAYNSSKLSSTPVIKSLSSSSGPTGTSVTLYGSGFTTSQAVLFGVLPITDAALQGGPSGVFQYPITCAGAGGKLWPVGMQGYCSFGMQVSSNGTSITFTIPTAMQAENWSAGDCGMPDCFPSYSQGEEQMPITPNTYGIVVYNPYHQVLSNVVNFTVTN